MANGSNPTVDEHYIPQIYLKGFSQDGKTIYRYDLKTDKATSKPIPIRSVAFKKNLYEITDDKGNFLARNRLEHVLSGFEGLFSEKRTELLTRVNCQQSHIHRNIIDDTLRDFWSVYVVLQMLRTPQVLQIAKIYTQEYYKDKVLPIVADIVAVSACLPFFSELTPESKNIFIPFVQQVCSLEMFVIVDPKERFLTSDNPVVSISENFLENGIDLIIFPITSRFAIVWSTEKDVPEHIANSAITISSEDVLHVDQNVVLFANHCVFSRHAFTDFEKEFIRDVNHSNQRKSFKANLEDEALSDLCKEIQDKD